MTLSVRGRLLVFLIAVAFIPMFTMLGLARTTEARFASGIDLAKIVELLASGSLWVFGLYTVLGVVLTLVLARTLTEPIGEVARALARIRDGEMDVAVAVESADELGRLQEGVNDMVAALRDRAHILSAFGRVVEPAIRDRLLSGALQGQGELRAASVLFVDLRGFTAMAEKESPDAVVATLNEFFTAVGAWVRDCGGFVDKYIGDAALVVFGLFDESAEGPARGAAAAVRCATGLCDRLDELNERRRADSKSRARGDDCRAQRRRARRNHRRVGSPRVHGDRRHGQRRRAPAAAREGSRETASSSRGLRSILPRRPASHVGNGAQRAHRAERSPRAGRVRVASSLARYDRAARPLSRT